MKRPKPTDENMHTILVIFYTISAYFYPFPMQKGRNGIIHALRQCQERSTNGLTMRFIGIS